ncbi:5'/3'-nucleotidase SurE [Nocardiopsis sp. N85]|uniref:5'/3'-nucleotidase SurE n=1 Tax=Nocardiopsis sp. N85 TaxID=3029400 RepID=UPI00237F68B0|nr:5'/3'-nucleotidase SurE [Nocardiopsis sp. N85]MDE3721708.1 5'/3'-nucleotidase SurE [Nocardiopsis sp. N85]
MTPMRRTLASTALLLIAATACAAPDDPSAPEGRVLADFPPASLEGVRVLVGNDDSMRGEEPDGGDGLGLYALRAALCDAGADVVVFAPWAQQSSMSAALSHEGAFGLGAPPAPPEEYADACSDAPSGGAVHGVCVEEGPCRPDSPSATPVDALGFALAHGLPEVVGWDGPPDLVVSGVNSGPNVASQIPHSGTIGVASAAVAAGVPALALSASVNEDLVVTPETLTATAAFGTDLIARMHGADLLTGGSDGYVVNVNHPASPDGAPGTDVRWTRAGAGTVLAVDYEGEDAFTPAMRLCGPEAPGCLPETRDDADAIALLAEGAVSVSALTVDRAYASGEDPTTVEGLSELVTVLGNG